MHAEARRFVSGHAGPVGIVIEYGGRDVNGGVRDLFDAERWVSIDLQPGPGVDVVADAATWRPTELADVVVCCEVLEHTDRAEEIIANAAATLRPGGRLLLTAACDDRAPHSGVDGGPVRPGETYCNVDTDDLARWLADGFKRWKIETHPDRGDVYAAAVTEEVADGVR